MFQPPPLPRNLRAALRDLSSARPDVRASAARDLAAAGHEDPGNSTAALEPLLDDPVADVRAEAAISLGALGLATAVPALARKLADRESQVRQCAAIALGQIGGESALDHLSRALLDPQPDVRFQALLAVLELSPDRALAACLDAIGQDDVWIASEAALQLGGLLAPDPFDEPSAVCTEPNRARAREALRAALARSEGRLAVCAAISLAKLGDPQGEAPLLEFVRGRARDEHDLRLEAILALGAVGGEGARAALESIAWRLFPSLEREQARAALAMMGDARAREKILSQLRSRRTRERQSAAHLAGVGRLSEALPDIESMLRGGVGDAEVLVRAVVSIGGESARAALDRLSREGSLPADARDAVRRALRRLG